MFFTGDASSRKRVNLGGRSSKGPDRQKLLEQARLERQRRLDLRQQNAAALKIQKYFRGRRAVNEEKLAVRQKFLSTYGSRCQKLDRYCFGPDSEFLCLLLFFFHAKDPHDFDTLVGACSKLIQYANLNEDIVSIVAGVDYWCKRAIVDFRLTRFTYSCLLAVHQNRNRFGEQAVVTKGYPSKPVETLLETVAMLLKPGLPWVCKTVDYLTNENAFHLLQEIFLLHMSTEATSNSMLLLERILILLASYTGPGYENLMWIVSSEIISIPFIWKYFSQMKEVFATERMFEHYIGQMAIRVYSQTLVLPDDIFDDFPGSICLLGNILEISRIVLSRRHCTRELAVDFAAVASYLLETVPPLTASLKGTSQNEDELAINDEDKVVLNVDLQRQILSVIDARFLEHLVNALFGDMSYIGYSRRQGPSNEDLSAIGGICYFLHVSLLVVPLESFMTGLAYRTEIVLILWNFIKWCHENKQWPSFSKLAVCFPKDAPGWLLPLAVFCPIYKYMLTIIDNEEFYEQEKPLSLKDIKCLVIILKEVLWDLLWINPGKAVAFHKGFFPSCNKLSLDDTKNVVRTVTSDLLNQLQDWNNRQPFMSSSDFHAHEAVGDTFISQASSENSWAQGVLRHAPFLIPFTSRVKIFTSQLAASRERDEHHPAFSRYRFRIRRNQIFEDAFSQLSGLSEEELRGQIRITFVNELGAEEAGIDGGGIFKDFIESVAKKTFDVQYGLFKETNNHLLYPNPGSGMIHEQHLQVFHFLGTILGKAMFEGILIDIPFATFFLSKLKQKHNFLNDLPSLDPELYRHLLFLKHYKGDVSDLELYFVVVNNDYGEQTEEELLPGGKNIRVTKANVITFIHLVANYRLNFQMRHQCLHFLRGFQKIIKKEWIDMFSEHEIQLLVSGSTDGMDIEDLRSNTQYSGGYHDDHPVILMLWEVIKYLSKENQMKFLKFVTGCSRGPLLGFNYLEPKFCIQRTAPLEVPSEDIDRLPTSATCMNLLKLPPYRRKEQLREKLLYAINAEAGFDLS